MQPADLSQVSSTNPCSPVTWASKVKQPPKAKIPPTTSVKLGCPSPSNAKDSKSQGWNKMSPSPKLATETEVEEVVAKKKRKKKKNKECPNNEHPKSGKFTDENIVIQEPPKFQDNEEFPDLMSSTGVAERGLRPENRSYSSGSWGPQKKLESSKAKGSGRKSKTPVQLDLGGMLAALEHKQHIDKTKASTKPVVLSIGGAVSVLSREPNSITKIPQTKPGQAPHNPLDSSAPLVKKGKQREVPKAKKPTSLKKIILKEREQRKQLQTSPPQDLAQEVKEDHLDDAEKTGEGQDFSEQPLGSSSPEDMVSENTVEPEVACSASTDESSKNLPDATSVVPVHQPNTNLPKIHSRRFREYCSQVLSKEVDTCVTDLLKELVRFQDRLYLKDPAKAKTKRRLVMGLREVLKHLKLKKLKCIIISPNCEKIQSKGGLDDTLQTIIACACEQNIPFVFALNRKALGRCVNKAVPVSVVGIFSYDGAQDHFHKLYELTMQARQAYKDMVCSLQNENADEGDKVESVLENSQHNPMEVNAEPTADGAEEPNYIKVWKRMLEEQYTPYTMSLEETVTNDMFNFHLS